MRKRSTPKKRRLALEFFQREVAKGEKTRTLIYQDLAGMFGVESRTIQRWIYGGGGRRYAIETLRDEAYAKCTKGDHSWFDDSRFEGLAYRCEPSYEVGYLGTIEARSFRKTCYFCGYSRGEFIV